jgi:type II secretory pathway component PulJ
MTRPASSVNALDEQITAAQQRAAELEERCAVLRAELARAAMTPRTRPGQAVQMAVIVYETPELAALIAQVALSRVHVAELGRRRHAAWVATL